MQEQMNSEPCERIATMYIKQIIAWSQFVNNMQSCLLACRCLCSASDATSYTIVNGIASDNTSWVLLWHELVSLIGPAR